MRIRQGEAAQGVNESAGIWLRQNGPNADRAFLGMMDDDHVGPTGVGWGLHMNTNNGVLTFRNDFGRPDGPVTLSLFGSRVGDVGDSVLFLRSGGGVVAFDGGDDKVGIGTRTPRSALDVNGHVKIAGGIATDNLPILGAEHPGWATGGVHTRDVLAESVIMVGDNACYMDSSGTLKARIKHFTIDHPLDPQGRKLVHASIEGPEAGVYYRGEAELDNGEASVDLPAYFEALTRAEHRTVLVTPILDDDGSACPLAVSAVQNGQFRVRALDKREQRQRFYWEVKAVRADIEPVEVEIERNEPDMRGSAPWRIGVVTTMD